MFSQISTIVDEDGKCNIVHDEKSIHVKPKPTKLGVMIVGLNGNNGSTFAASVAAIKNDITWRSKNGEHNVNVYGSISQYGDMSVGLDQKGNHVYQSIKSLCNLVPIENIYVGGWDIHRGNLNRHIAEAKVLPYDLQSKLSPHMSNIPCFRGVYYPDFIATNQKSRVNFNLLGDHASLIHLNQLRTNIRMFKSMFGLDKVIVLWSASTEKLVEVKNVHSTWYKLLHGIKTYNPNIAPSVMYAAAALLEECHFYNCSPQNTLIPGIVQLAKNQGTYIGGNDLKSGQTKLKGVMVDYLLSAGFKLRSIVSYNHLGNNDGKNLDEEAQFNSKKKSKSGLVDSIVKESKSLYVHKYRVEKPDHVVVIKYVPYVKDDKKALDEYIASCAFDEDLIMNINTTCPDTCLAVGVMLDIVLFGEWLSRISIDGKTLESVQNYLSIFFKDPINAKSDRFFTQLAALKQLILATNKLPMALPSRL